MRNQRQTRRRHTTKTSEVDLATAPRKWEKECGIVTQCMSRGGGRRALLAILLAILIAMPVAGSMTADLATDCDAPEVACGGETWEAIVTPHPAKLIAVPLVRQGRDNTCGVSCVQSLLRYAGYEFDVREELLLDRLGTDESGTPIAGMTNLLNNTRRQARGSPVIRATLHENMTIADLIRSIDSGGPVICLIQAWQSGASGNYELKRDYSRVWDSGHYAIAIGYDSERIYFMDPSTMGAYTYIPRDELDARWHGLGEITSEGIERYEHTGIVVAIDAPQYTPCSFYKIL